MLRKRLLTLTSLAILAALAIGLLWLASGREIVPGVIIHPFGPCTIDWHAEIGALADTRSLV